MQVLVGDLGGRGGGDTSIAVHSTIQGRWGLVQGQVQVQVQVQVKVQVQVQVQHLL